MKLKFFSIGLMGMAVLCLVGSIVVFGRKPETKVISDADVNTRMATEGAAQRTPASGPVQVVRFALYDVGILPRERHVSQGRVVISLVDYTGGTGGLVVERVTDQGREHAGHVRRNGSHWRGRHELRLTAGTYRLHDASRPENYATLIVEP